MNRLLISLFAVASVAAAGTTALSAQETERVDGSSQSGKIAWHVVQSKDGADVLISEGDQGESAAQKLCTVLGVANTKVEVSPDDFWIIVQSGGGSVGISLSVFQRTKGVSYVEKKEMDIATPILKNAFKVAGKEAAADMLDHIYTRLLAWSADSETILVQVAGHGGKTKLDPYLAVYDLGRQTISLDLTKFNAKAAKP